MTKMVLINHHVFIHPILKGGEIHQCHTKRPEKAAAGSISTCHCGAYNVEWR